MVDLFIMLVQQIVAGVTTALAADFHSMERHMSALDEAIGKLRDDVARLRSVDDSAITMLAGIQEQIRSGINDALASGATSDQLTALADLDQALQSQTAALAEAVAQNTAAAPGGGAATPPAGGATPPAGGAVPPTDAGGTSGATESPAAPR